MLNSNPERNAWTMPGLHHQYMSSFRTNLYTGKLIGKRLLCRVYQRLKLFICIFFILIVRIITVLVQSVVKLLCLEVNISTAILENFFYKTQSKLTNVIFYTRFLRIFFYFVLNKHKIYKKFSTKMTPISTSLSLSLSSLRVNK